jgi:O-antigen/teichoic acid export membrane protein
MEKKQPTLRKITRSSFYLYLSTLVASFLGYIFWLIISKLTLPDMVGLASTTVSIAVILGSFTLLGIPTGIQRFFGKAVAEKDMDSLKLYLSNGFTILILASGIFACGFLFLNWLTEFTSLPMKLLVIIGLLIFTGSIYPLFNALFISLLRTELVMYVSISASACRLITGILLVLIGLGAFGITFGYFTLSLISLIVYMLVGLPKLTLQRNYAGELFKAGHASWLPTVIFILGTQLGVVAVYGFHGAFQAGQYFIAYAIARVVLAIPSSLLGLMFPVLSGMEDGRKRASWRAIRLTLAIVTPIAVILVVYAKIVLEFFGSDYVEAWPILVLLLVGIIPLAIVEGVNVLAYAYGLYSLVLALGIIVSLPRTILYLFLTPLFGGFGTAEAYLVGTIAGVIGAGVVANKIGLVINWKIISTIFLIPLILGLILHFSGLWWVLGVPLILTVTLLAYARLGIVYKKDLVEIVKSFLPEKLYKVGVEKLYWIMKILYGDE